MIKRGLCGQVVTIYHAVPEKKRIDRYLLRDVFCQLGSREVPDAGGCKTGAAMLLVVPEDAPGASGAAGLAADGANAGAVGDGSGPGTGKRRYGVTYRLAAGDRVLLGEGEEVGWEDWPAFVPAVVPGLGAITYVLPMFYRGGIHHVEAGAWWSAGGAGAGRLAR